jgi:hypothetical protein
MEDFDKIKGNPSIIGHNDRKVKEYIWSLEPILKFL